MPRGFEAVKSVTIEAGRQNHPDPHPGQQPEPGGGRQDGRRQLGTGPPGTQGNGRKV